MNNQPADCGEVVCLYRLSRLQKKKEQGITNTEDYEGRIIDIVIN
jgi:hypothetical protein